MQGFTGMKYHTFTTREKSIIVQQRRDPYISLKKVLENIHALLVRNPWKMYVFPLEDGDCDLICRCILYRFFFNTNNGIAYAENHSWLSSRICDNPRWRMYFGRFWDTKHKETPKKMVVWLRPTYLSMGPFAGWLSFFPGKQKNPFSQDWLVIFKMFYPKSNSWKPWKRSLLVVFNNTSGLMAPWRRYFAQSCVSHLPFHTAPTVARLQRPR